MKTVLLNQCSHLPQVLSLILAATFAGCTDTGAPDPVLLEIVAGDGQEAEFASDLVAPLVVQVTDVDGLPRRAVRVEWRVLQGGGSIEPEGVFSDEEGLVRARWTLGTELGDQSVTVAARGTSTTFRAWATPPPPADWAEVVEIRPSILRAANGWRMPTTGIVGLFNSGTPSRPAIHFTVSGEWESRP